MCKLLVNHLILINGTITYEFQNEILTEIIKYSWKQKLPVSDDDHPESLASSTLPGIMFYLYNLIGKSFLKILIMKVII